MGLLNDRKTQVLTKLDFITVAQIYSQQNISLRSASGMSGNVARKGDETRKGNADSPPCARQLT